MSRPRRRTGRIASKLAGKAYRNYVRTSKPSREDRFSDNAVALLSGFCVALLIIPTTVLLATILRVVLVICFLLYKGLQAFSFKALFRKVAFLWLGQSRGASACSAFEIHCEELRGYLDDQVRIWEAQGCPTWQIRLHKAYFSAEAAGGILIVLLRSLLSSKRIL